MLKITDNVTRIEKEVQDGDFNLNLKDHILYLPSFVDPDVCKDVVNNLKNVGLDKSTPYTDGLLNDYTDSYFDPDISSITDIKDKVLVLEMGMRGVGQIENISKYSEPNIAVITNSCLLYTSPSPRD